MLWNFVLAIRHDAQVFLKKTDIVHKRNGKMKTSEEHHKAVKFHGGLREAKSFAKWFKMRIFVKSVADDEKPLIISRCVMV